MPHSTFRHPQATLAWMIAALTTGFALSALASTPSQEGTSLTNHSPPTTNGSLGLGLMLGDPTGVDLKYWLSGSNALHFGFAYSFNDYTELMGSYLWEFPRAFGPRAKNQFVPYVGVGGALFYSTTEHPYYGSSSAAFGVRIPLGVEYLPHGAPLGITAELAPGVGLVPSTFGFFQGFLGIRVYL